MKHLVTLLILTAGLFSMKQLAAQSVPSTLATAHFTCNAGRLRMGTFAYRDMDHGNGSDCVPPAGRRTGQGIWT
jgi:hypothetical protein